MKRIGIAAMTAGVLLLGACGSRSNAANDGSALGAVGQARSFKNAGEWIQVLNHHGVTCRPTGHPGVGPEPAGAMPAACVLPDGDRVTVLILKDAAAAYKRQFSTANGPQRVFYGPNWLVIVPQTAPEQVVHTIQTSFHAQGG